HHAIDRERELLIDLVEAELGHGRIASALLGDQPMGRLDRPLATLDRDVHGQSSTRVLRGRATIVEPAARIRSTPRGNSAWFRWTDSQNASDRHLTSSLVSPSIPGPVKRSVPFARNSSTWTMTVAERSGYSSEPGSNASSDRTSDGSATTAKRASLGSTAIGHPQCKRRDSMPAARR